MSREFAERWVGAGRAVLGVVVVLAGCADGASGSVGAVRTGPELDAGDAAVAAGDAGTLPVFDVPSGGETDGEASDGSALTGDGVATTGDGAAATGDAAVAAGDAAVDAAPACRATEICDNGIDDTCDGVPDERCPCIPGTTQRCFTGPAAAAGLGTCAFGAQRCEGVGEFGTWSACAGATVPSGELCDGLDNDCDGVADDGCDCRADDARGCYTGPSATRGVGACRDGSQVCASGTGGVGSAWGACAGETMPATEACDGVDNDCNGTVDDGCSCRPGETRSCYGGPAASDGVGRCRGGTQTCGGTEGSPAWGACTGQELPAAEACDGVDNDCDGVVDDGCECRPDETRSCYSGPMGTRDVGPCAAGTQTCAAGAGGVGSAWGACSGERLPTAETCDDADNNCNGATDEVCACRRGETRPCYAGPAGTAGVGTCAPGAQMCSVGGGVAAWGACAGASLPGAEACDGVDNNCDGMVDDGCACRAGAAQPCYTGPSGTAGVGACRVGAQPCALGAGGVGSAWGACSGEVQPGAEACDGVDNDCDGVVDDGCACAPGATRSCAAGSSGAVGACRAGAQTCVAGAGGVGSAWGACSGEVGPSAEACDGVDNDCNGLIDETCACTPGASRSCYGGPSGTAGVGLCRAGAQTCASSGGAVAWGACGGERVPSAEACDGLDNDCDGVVDDGCACAPGATRSCYAGPSGTAGVGACRAGSQTCAAGAGGVGSAWGACGGQVLPGAEVCDGVDSDCDGTVDQGCACAPGAARSCYTGTAGTAGVGACRAGAQTCAAGAGGVGSAWGACGGQVLPTAEVCDRADNNCNGRVDDGLSCGPTAVCPAPVTALAGSTVTLAATVTGATSARWEVISAPTGGASTLGSPTSNSTAFSSVIVGAFTLRFTATDAMGRTASCETSVTMQGHGLRVELVWNTGVAPPTAAGRVDLDLHVHDRTATTWFSSPHDCYYNNQNPGWDARGTADDPSLDTDNVTGFGPENVRVDSPLAGAQTYTIGVHNYTGSVRTTATVRIYCGQTLASTLSHVITGTTTSADDRNDFWRVARVTFTAPDACTVAPVDDVVTYRQARTGSP